MPLNYYTINTSDDDGGKIALVVIENDGTEGSNLEITEIGFEGPGSSSFTILDPATILSDDGNSANNLTLGSATNVDDLSVNVETCNQQTLSTGHNIPAAYNTFLYLDTEADNATFGANVIVLHTKESIVLNDTNIISLTASVYDVHVKHAILIKYDPSERIGTSDASLSITSNAFGVDSVADGLGNAISTYPLTGNSNTALTTRWQIGGNDAGTTYVMTPVLVGMVTPDVIFDYKIYGTTPVNSKVNYKEVSGEEGNNISFTGLDAEADAGTVRVLDDTGKVPVATTNLGSGKVDFTDTISIKTDDNYFDGNPVFAEDTLDIQLRRHYTFYKTGDDTSVSGTQLTFDNTERGGTSYVNVPFTYEPGDYKVNFAEFSTSNVAITAGTNTASSFSIVSVSNDDSTYADTCALDHISGNSLWVKVAFNPTAYSGSSINRNCSISITPTYAGGLNVPDAAVHAFTTIVQGTQTPVAGNADLTSLAGDITTATEFKFTPGTTTYADLVGHPDNSSTFDLSNTGDLDISVTEVYITGPNYVSDPADTYYEQLIPEFTPEIVTEYAAALVISTELTSTYDALRVVSTADQVAQAAAQTAYDASVAAGDPAATIAAFLVVLDAAIAAYTISLDATNAAELAKDAAQAVTDTLAALLPSSSNYNRSLATATDYLYGTDWGFIIHPTSNTGNTPAASSNLAGVTLTQEGELDLGGYRFNVFFWAYPNTFMPTIEGTYEYTINVITSDGVTHDIDKQIDTTNLVPAISLTDLSGDDVAGGLDFGTIAW